MQKLTPCLWFDDNAEEAVNFYVSVFKNSRIISLAHYGESASKASGRPKGSVMEFVFELDGQRFMALNGGPAFTFTPAISFMVNCETQQEIDELWEKLSEGGTIMECGWLTDKFGMAWQIVPAAIAEWISDTDPEKSDRVMHALLQMKKLDLETLKQAAVTPSA